MQQQSSVNEKTDADAAIALAVVCVVALCLRSVGKCCLMVTRV